MSAAAAAAAASQHLHYRANEGKIFLCPRNRSSSSSSSPTLFSGKKKKKKNKKAFFSTLPTGRTHRTRAGAAPPHTPFLSADISRRARTKNTPKALNNLTKTLEQHKIRVGGKKQKKKTNNPLRNDYFCTHCTAHGHTRQGRQLRDALCSVRLWVGKICIASLACERCVLPV